MDRARLATFAALLSLAVLGSVAVGPAAVRFASWEAAGEATWSTSALLLSEVGTGGASASDEFVELVNAGTTPLDLAGHEVVYVTSSGSTVTRKATWAAALTLPPGRRLLIANSAGVHGTIADSVYTGGLAGTGGTLVLRPIGGAPIDAVGWGDATNVFVEGTAVPAPPAGSSIERRPGGAAGNGVDTNDNAADWFVQAAPSPQNLAAAPVPMPDPTTTPAPSADGTPTATAPPSMPPTTASPRPTASPTGSVSPSATAIPDPSPAPSQAATPAPSLTAAPTDEATPAPTGTPTPSVTSTATASPSVTASPSPTPLPSPTVQPSVAPSASAEPSPSPSPTLAVQSIADARGMPDGASATIAGTLTTGLGAVEGGRGAWIQDATAGIALYLDAPAPERWPAGTTVLATGTVDERYGQRTVRVAAVDLVPTGSAALPAAVSSATVAVTEALEGLRVLVTGTTAGTATTLADGTALWVDDGSGAVRVIAAPAALGAAAVPAGSLVTVTGVVGQRDSSGAGTAGYRIHATEAGDFVVEPPPSPTPLPSVVPTPAPDPSTAPTPSPTPTSFPTASPTSSPEPTPTSATIEVARRQAVGSTVTVGGVVTAEAGRIGSPPVVVIQDATAGIAVKVPDGAARPARGTRVLVTGVLHDPYGQLEVRTTAERFAPTGVGPLPAPQPIRGASVGEALEGRLVILEGVADGGGRRSASGDVTLDVEAEDGTLVRIVADASSGLDASTFGDGAAYRLTGVVGQRASRKGSLDGYRVWLRGPSDVVVIAPAPAGRDPDDVDGDGGDTGGAGGSGGGSDPVAHVTISRALAGGDGFDAAIEGTVTADARLLDATGRRIVVEDASAAVEVLVPTGASAPPVGYRVRVVGTMGQAYGAPRLRAKELDVVGTAAPRQPMALGAAPGAAHEWRLVRMSGTIGDVKRSGDRWRAELEIAAGAVPVAGLSGAGIPAAAVQEGSRATVTGIVRRPHPSTTDRRFALVPRSGADLAIVPVAAGAAGGVNAGGGSAGAGADGATTPGDGGSVGGGGDAGGGAADAAPDGVADADLADLSSQVGKTVRVGGLVVELETDGFRLDDGTSVGRVVLAGTALEYLPLLELGDALNATGTVEDRGDEVALLVEDPAGIIRVGDLSAAIGSDRPAGSPPPRTATPRGARDWELADIGTSGVVGIAALVLASAVSAGAALVRRRDGRLRLRARVLARLAGIAGGSAAAAASPDATVGPAGPHGPPSLAAAELADERSHEAVGPVTSSSGTSRVPDARGV